MADTIRAAGAVLWRPVGAGHGVENRGDDGGVEVCVVHRPAYDDWSLPKGKLHEGEHPLVAAVREVREETGYGGVPQLRLPPVEYTMPDGRRKEVDFWLMRADDGPAAEVRDATEVDRREWLSPAEATARLSYPDDGRLVRHVAELPRITALTSLVRHAHAGERKKWSGNDALRPIDPYGQTEADGLAVVLALFRPERLVAATPLRCRQTLEPLGARLGLPIVTDSAFAEPPDPEDVPARVKPAAVRLAELREGGTAVVCSQGKMVPPVLALLAGGGDPEPYKTPKGGGWVIAWSGDRLAGLSRL